VKIIYKIILVLTIQICFSGLIHAQSDSLWNLKIYKFRIASADSFFIQKNYERAAFLYQQAMDLKREDVYAKNMFNECTAYLTEEAKRKITAQLYMDAGAECLIQKRDTVCAREYFMKALALYDDCSSRGWLSFLDKNMKCCVVDKYKCSVRKGDIFFQCNNPEEAIVSYKEALAIHEAQYPKDRIKLCEKIINERNKNNQTKKN